jgi:hypothetical protein
LHFWANFKTPFSLSRLRRAAWEWADDLHYDLAEELDEEYGQLPQWVRRLGFGRIVASENRGTE